MRCELTLCQSIRTPAQTLSDKGTIGQSSVHRAQFLDLLASILPDTVDAKFGRRLTGNTELPDGRIQLTFADGSTATCDVLIAFDGIKSAVRKSVYPEREDGIPPRWTGTYAYRGLVPYDRLKEAIGQHLAECAP